MPRTDAFRELLSRFDRLRFEAHDIRKQLDATGRYALPFEREFPLSIRLFRVRSGAFTPGVTWHEQLELFMPLDSGVELKMAGRTIALEAGDLLVVDNMKPHHLVDRPGLKTRLVVVSFLPELVYSLGSPSHDFAFLLPFYCQLESRAHVMELRHADSAEVCLALGRLLEAYFPREPAPYREAACKASLLALLLPLARRFQDAEVLRGEFERQRQRALRFSKLLEALQRDCAQRIALRDAARICGMSSAQFTRNFRQVAGMSYLAYVTHVRLSEAARWLRLGDRTIAEIADMTGFADQSHFDRRFKRAFGMTPRQFQQRNDPPIPRDPNVQ